MTSKSSSQTQMADIVKDITILGQSTLAGRLMIEQSYTEAVLSSSFATCVTCRHQLLNGLQRHLASLMNLMARSTHTILTICSKQTRVSYTWLKSNHMHNASVQANGHQMMSSKHIERTLQNGMLL